MKNAFLVNSNPQEIMNTPQKPDFEKLVSRAAFKSHPLNVNPDVVSVDSVVYYLDEVWENYVLPLTKRNEELEKDRKRCDANHWMNECLKKCSLLEKAQKNNEELLERIAELEKLQESLKQDKKSALKAMGNYFELDPKKVKFYIEQKLITSGL